VVDAFDDAETNSIATTAMRGLLSNLSSQRDIPLIIEIAGVIEHSTQARGVSFVTPCPLTSMAVR
jgi:hypothetical protein